MVQSRIGPALETTDFPSFSPKRTRHIESISIRNLTLNPLRDHLSALLLPPAIPQPNLNAPRSKFAQDDTDLYLARRRRTNSTASFTAHANRVLPLECHEAERERAQLSQGKEDAVSVTPAQSIALGAGMERRKSLTHSIKRGMSGGIEEEVEPSASPPHAGTFDAASRFTPDPSTSTSTTTAYPFPLRRRSTSRASANSIATSNSGSTIRLHPRVAQDTASTYSDKPRSTTSGRTSYTSDAQLLKEKTRRIETIKRRLVDSRITLSIAPPLPPVIPVDGLPTMNGRGKISRSNSLNSVGRRSRNRSDPSSPSRSISGSPAASTPALPPPPPFFTSSAQHSTTHPSFEIESSGFSSAERSEGMHVESDAVMVGIWTRSGEQGGKGKGKDVEVDEGNDMKGWKLLEEVRIELCSLISIGQDPTEFPPLLPNTLIFRLSDREYYIRPASLPTSEEGDDSSDGGNQSDPGVSSQVVLRKKSGVGDEWERRKKGVVGSAREGKKVVCAGIQGILRFVKLDQEIDNVNSAIEERIKETDLLLEDSTNMPLLEREKSELQDHLEDLSTVGEDLKAEVEKMTVAIRNRWKALNARRTRLRDAQKLVEGNLLELQAGEEVLLESTKSCKRLTKAQSVRRTTIITTLASLFPIEPFDVLGTSLLFTIHSLPLPNSTYTPLSLADESIPSALGYAAQVVNTLAAYMGVPLHYPIQCLGSRSAILDLISVMRGPRAFPLYDKGVERYRFDYGVFLLNKNIEQLMYTQNLIVLDLRNTLPNLKTLLLSLSYDSSHSSFASSILSTRTISPQISLETNPSDDIRLPLLPRTIEELCEPGTPKNGTSLRSISPTPTLTQPPKSANINNTNGSAVPRLKQQQNGVEKKGVVVRGKGKDIESVKKLGRIS